MRFLSVSLFCMLCFSCVTTNSNSQKAPREEIIGLEGMSVEFIQAQWGEPDAKFPLAAGQSLKYNNVFVKDEDPFTGENADRNCVIKLEVDAEGLVADWDYEACQSIKMAADEKIAEGSVMDAAAEGQTGGTVSEDAVDQESLEMIPLTP